jgi:hypothetical protein
MKYARPARGTKAAKPRPKAPKLDYSDDLTDEHFAAVKGAHHDINRPDAKRGGVEGAGLFPND